MKNQKRIIAILFISFLISVILIKITFTNNIDEKVSNIVYDFFQNNLITGISLFITNYTIGTIYGATVISIYLFFKKLYKSALIYIIFGLLSFIIVSILKYIIGRERPFDILNNVHYLSSQLPHELSFPSGHTTIAFFTAYYLVNRLNLKRKYAILIYSLAIVVGITRVYLGAHFILDVLSGAIVGTLIAILSIFVYEKFISNANFTQIINGIRKE